MNEQHRCSTTAGGKWLRRLPWLPIPLLLFALAALWAARLPTAHESPGLLLAFNFVFSTLASLLVAVLIGWSFVARGAPELLLLGCGVLLWGAAGTVGPALLARHGINATITVHNILVWLAATSNLAGALLALRPRRAPQMPGLILAMAYAGAACLVWLVVMLVLEGWTPVFFVQDRGGTPIRSFTLGLATVMFAFTSALLWRANRPSPSAFVRWYVGALLLVATGLLGIAIESVHGGALSWTARTAQFLGGAYLLVAAIASVHESGVRGVSLSTALRESEERFRSVLENSLDIVYRMNVQTGQFEYISPVVANVVGYAPGELTALDAATAAAMIHPDDRPAMHAALARLEATGRAEAEYRQRTKSGDYRWLSNHMSLIRDGAGRPLYRDGNIRDITANKQAEEALRESEVKLATAFASMTEATFIADASGRLTDFNDEFVRYHRFKDRDECSRTIADCPKYLEAFFADGTPAPPEQWAMARALRGETASNVEYRLCRKETGETWWGSYSFAPIKDKDGGIVGGVVSAREITERKRTEEALRQSEERYRSMFSTMLEGFCVIEVLLDADRRPIDYRFLEINPAFEAQTGLRNAQGRRMRELAPEHEAHWFEVYGRIALTGEPARFVSEAKALNRWYDVSAFRIGGAESRKVAILFNDITERKRVEQTLHTTLRRFHTVMSSMYSGILLVGEDGRVEFANQAFCDCFGLGDAPETLEGLSASDTVEKIKHGYLHPDEAVGRIQEIVTRGEPVKGEELAMRGGRTCLRDFVPLHVNGKPSGRVWIHIDITERKRVEDVLRFLGQCGASDAGEGFFQELARYLAQALDMDFVCIDRLAGDQLSAQTLAVFHNGRFEDNVSYTLRDTPCGDVVGKRICCFARGVRGLFPKDAVLQDLQAESYVGTTLWNAQGKPIGLIAVIGRRPLADTRPMESILQMVAVRAAGELERKQAEESLQASEQRLRLACTAANAGAWEWELATNRNIWSDELWELYGLVAHSCEPSYEAWLQTVHPDDRAAAARSVQEAARDGKELTAEWRVQAAGGKERWLMSRGQPSRDSRGAVVRYIGIVLDITARKQAEEAARTQADAALRLSEQEFHSLAEAMPQIVWVTRPDGWNIYFNRQWVDYTGMTLEESYGHGWNTPFHPDDKQRAWDAWQRATQHNERYALECRLRRHDGVYRWWLIRGEPMRGADGEILKWFGTCTDIEEIKNNETVLEQRVAERTEALRASERRLAYHVENSPLAVIEWGPDMRLSRWAGGAERIFGWKAEEVLGKKMDEFRWIYHEDATQVAEVSSELTTGANPRRFSANRNYRKDGTVVQCEWYNSSLVDESGKLQSILSLVLDVTERKQAEESLRASRAAALNLMEDAVEARERAERVSTALRVSEERLALAASGTRIGMFDRNMVTGEILATEQTIRLIGLVTTTTTTTTTTLSQSYQYRDWAARVHPEDLSRVEGEMLRCVREKALFEVEYRVVWPDGSLHWLAVRGVFQFDVQGAPQHLLGIVLDITGRRQAEEGLREAAADLARSNKDLEQFAYVTSHDLKEPLRMVTGFMSLLKERYAGRFDAKADEYIDFAVDAAARMQRMVDDLLSYSRVGREKVKAPVDAAAALDAALRNLRAGLEDSGAAITRDPLPTVRANSLELTQVLQNLIGNAIKFRDPKRPVAIHIGVRKVLGESFWLFSVRDNGIGIDPQYHDRLFAIFQRLHTREEYPGTGVGLAICKKIVDRCGGKIWIESELGQGSTFHFTLPE